MLVSFGDDTTADLFHGNPTKRVRRVPPEVRRHALRKLDMLEAAHRLEDLRSPPGNRLEALQGDLRGLHSVCVDGQWRLVFRWTQVGPAQVRLVDYH